MMKKKKVVLMQPEEKTLMLKLSRHSQYAMAPTVLRELTAESQAKSFQNAQVINCQLKPLKELAEFFQCNGSNGSPGEDCVL
jgi:hypothetical protein